MKIVENEVGKALYSKKYNFIFRYDDGFFMRWGEHTDDGPQFSPYGPEILDLEISSGKCNGRCEFCYKDNGADGNTHHMTLDEFKIIFNKMPKTLTQIAFGICDISSNPDFFAMMEYSRKNNVTPNYTCNGLEVTEEVAERTSKTCGAVAVSLVNKDKTYDAIRKFVKAGMIQCNMHYMLSEETYDKAFDVVDDMAEIKGFNAIVFLQYKPKGKNTDAFHPILDVKKYTRLINYCDDKQVNYGFDSCSAPIFLESIKADYAPFDGKLSVEMDKMRKMVNSWKRRREERLTQMAEPCDSGLFSSYINCYGKFFVCSFAEGEDKWVEGIDVLNCKDFIKDVWMSRRLKKWRKRLIKNERSCPIYEISLAKV